MPRTSGPDRPGAPPAAAPVLATQPPPAPDSTSDVAQEDFLFHLYRGNELLQEGRVLEAKEALEQALTMRPLDAKGQDLLAAVYFRLGLYPRAIQIYEGLEAGFARDAAVKINLALCYLKTGQPEPARRVLQDAVRLNPEHKRAWGYLGLALQKLGELDNARIAFERGGYPLTAKRVTEMRQRASSPPLSTSMLEADEGVRDAAQTAFSELDAGDLRFALAESEAQASTDGPWHALEPGEPGRIGGGEWREAFPEAAPTPLLVRDVATMPPPAAAGAIGSTTEGQLSTRLVPPPHAAPSKGDRAAAMPALFPPAAPPGPPETEAPAVALHGSSTLLVNVGADRKAFAARLDSLRVSSGSLATRILHRRARDADTSEVLGGIGSPFVHMSGDAQIALGGRLGQKLVLLTLEDDLAFVREDLLLGFEMRLAYENGRVALEPGASGEGGRPGGDGIAVVQLRGTGSFVLEVPYDVSSVPSLPERPLFARREWVVGWLGRLLTRALPPALAPSGQRGLVGFTGAGTVLLCAG